MDNTIHAEGSTRIERSVGEVFEFLCNPSIDLAELTPTEDRVTEWSEIRGVGSVRRFTVEIAARQLDYSARCVEFEPPHRLGAQLEGELEGSQVWELTPEAGGTHAQLTIDIVKPQWTPAYLRDETTAARWGQMLVDQTLANVKSALEQAPVSD
ncbi:MAG: SRPBCC family protein [Chloroflexota bacterium]|nr:SRPBCC family protein [Chloroflexota bacterium]